VTAYTPNTADVAFRYEEFPYVTCEGEPADPGEFKRWLQSVKAEAWQEAESSFLEWVRTKDNTLYTAPENPYKEER